MASLALGGINRRYLDPTTESSYETALAKNTGLYNNINNQLQGVADNPGPTSRILSSPISYSPSADTTAALSNLSSLATTGGYTPEQIADIRARGVAPIRAAYAAAQKNVNQQRALQGGYSPNYSAVQAKMARDQGNSMAEQVTNINANLAQNIAQNRLAAASPYASAAGAESGRGLQTAQFNAENNAQTQEENANLGEAAQNRKLSAIDAQRSLYGTTPAQASLFGSQALSAAGINSNNQNQFLNRQQTGLSRMIGAFA